MLYSRTCLGALSLTMVLFSSCHYITYVLISPVIYCFRLILIKGCGNATLFGRYFDIGSIDIPY